jgi:hypothetical protein
MLLSIRPLKFWVQQHARLSEYIQRDKGFYLIVQTALIERQEALGANI